MTRPVRIALLALAMTLVILGMIAVYARDLNGGTEITLKTEPVDPRSLFLGHYATLGYAISRLGGDLLGGRCYERNEPIYVTLERGEDEWRAVAAAPAMPADGFGENRVTLRGAVAWHSGCRLEKSDESGEPPLTDPAPPLEEIRVSYGVEQYFASPGAARRLEELARRRPAEGEETLEPLQIILSVPRSGRALIKGVVIDGEKVYDQKIW
ncbi:MAG: GDYXXLXY domain-containing protein [Pseudomonadota bacterium]|nr:GDYXXLXY domain-containing protein [Pseudomonadota bacterium]